MLSVRRLTRRFAVAEGSVTALRDLSFEVGRGDFFVLVGASGSGKTTLLRCVAGLEVPDTGEVRIDGVVVSSDEPARWVPPQRRRLGMVFQSYAVWPHLTVYDNVALPLREGVQRIDRSEVDRRVRQVLELVELGALADRPATLLSGGQQQRVALARAIAVNSRVVLMDEPLSNLDARLREDVRVRIRDLAKQLGSTVVYVTHDQVEAMAMADHIALLRAGELLQVGRPVEVYRRPASPEVADFFGQVNWLEGVCGASGRVQTEVGSLRVSSPLSAGERVLLGIRPESLVPAGHDADNAIETRLASSAFLGDQVLAQLTAGTRMLAARGRTLPAVAGQAVRIAVEPDEVIVFPQGRTTHVSEHKTRASGLAGILGAALGLIATACATAAPAVAPTAPAAPAASFSPQVQQLIQAARQETVLKGAWSPSSFGGSAGFERLVQGMNKKYGLSVSAQFTPGIDEQAMAGRLAQEATAGQPATEDVYLGNPAGVHDAEPTRVFKSIDWRSIIDRPLTNEGEFDPVAPNGAAVAFASSVVGVTYNTTLVKGADVPHRLNDLLDPRWKGKIASTPYASGWREFVAPDLLGKDATFAFVRAFAPQVAGLIRCGESDRITSGEFWMLAMDCGANDVITLKRQGAPIDHVVLDDAAVVHNRYGAVPVNSSAPNAATLFVAYLETPEAQGILWEVDGLDFYLFPESNSRHAVEELRQAGGKVALDSPQWLASLPNFSETQKQLGQILQHPA